MTNCCEALLSEVDYFAGDAGVVARVAQVLALAKVGWVGPDLGGCLCCTRVCWCVCADENVLMHVCGWVCADACVRMGMC